MKKLLVFILFPFFGFAQTQVTFYTNHGNFIAQLHDSIVPITAGNFKSLTDSGFYDGVIFHRVIENFVIQGGDPTGTGSGGPGYTIPDEFDPSMSNVKKTLSMANAGPNTGGSQFFINLVNNTYLDYNKAPLAYAHAVFGIVRSGWEIVDSIAQTPVNSQDRPIDDVVMDSVRVTGSYLSVDELDKMKTTSRIYPNPLSSESVIDLYSESKSKVSISIFNQSGVLVHKSEESVNAGKTLIPLMKMGLNDWPSGVFIVTINNNGVVLHERIVKLN